MNPKRNLQNDAKKYSVRNDAFSKEKNLSKKNGEFRAKEDAIAEKKQQAEAFLLEAEGIKANQFEILERISGFTAEQAKEFLLKNLENELVRKSC